MGGGDRWWVYFGWLGVLVGGGGYILASGGWWVVVDGGIVQFYPIKYYLKVSRSRLKCSL